MLDTLFAKTNRRNISSNSHVMSLVKGISWRIVGSIDTILIAWLVTGQIHMAVSIGSVEIFTKIALYYLHDRAWEKIIKNKNKNEHAG
ncbi:MAG TPA: DUF2061 domain-containing protein [Chitinophagaceae bacterium]|nr:DUF2061 domain-containing protein [Chitinophagaceae bacterium]